MLDNDGLPVDDNQEQEAIDPNQARIWKEKAERYDREYPVLENEVRRLQSMARPPVQDQFVEGEPDEIDKQLEQTRTGKRVTRIDSELANTKQELAQVRQMLGALAPLALEPDVLEFAQNFEKEAGVKPDREVLDEFRRDISGIPMGQKLLPKTKRVFLNDAVREFEKRGGNRAAETGRSASVAVDETPSGGLVFPGNRKRNVNITPEEREHLKAAGYKDEKEYLYYRDLYGK